MQGLIVMLIVGAAMVYALRGLLPRRWPRDSSAPAGAASGALPALACQGCPVAEQCSKQRPRRLAGDASVTLN